MHIQHSRFLNGLVPYLSRLKIENARKSLTFRRLIDFSRGDKNKTRVIQRHILLISHYLNVLYLS